MFVCFSILHGEVPDLPIVARHSPYTFYGQPRAIGNLVKAHPALSKRVGSHLFYFSKGALCQVEDIVDHMALALVGKRSSRNYEVILFDLQSKKLTPFKLNRVVDIFGSVDVKVLAEMDAAVATWENSYKHGKASKMSKRDRKKKSRPFIDYSVFDPPIHKKRKKRKRKKENMIDYTDADLFGDEGYHYNAKTDNIDDHAAKHEKDQDYIEKKADSAVTIELFEGGDGKNNELIKRLRQEMRELKRKLQTQEERILTVENLLSDDNRNPFVPSDMESNVMETLNSLK